MNPEIAAAPEPLKPRSLKGIRIAVILAVSSALLLTLADSFTVEVPVSARVGEFTASGLQCELRPRFHQPYHLVLGVPGQQQAAPRFHGVLEIRGPGGLTQSVPLGSDTAEACNWLHDPSASGFILAWAAPQKFNEALRQGTVFQVRITLTEPLPPGCSLWLSSMKHVRLVTQRNA